MKSHVCLKYPVHDCSTALTHLCITAQKQFLPCDIKLANLKLKNYIQAIKAIKWWKPANWPCRIYKVYIQALPFEINFNLSSYGWIRYQFSYACIIMTQRTPVTHHPGPCYLCHFQIFDKFDSFPKKYLNIFRIKTSKLHLWRTA